MTVGPKIFSTAGIVEAWRAVSEEIVTSGERFNAVVHIERPSEYIDEQLFRFDPRQIVARVPSVFDVANTIFPNIREKKFQTREAFYSYYRRIYERGMRSKGHRSKWGTYFQRLISFGPDNVNQLERIVSAIENWKVAPHAAFVVHLSDASLDKPRPLGAPCWQFGEFTRGADDRLSLVVVYRSHDYFLKALGNFAGLNRLLDWVCEQTGRTAGTITCLSIFAHVGNQNVKTRALLSK